MFEIVNIESIDVRLTRHQVFDNGSPVSFGDTIDLWCSDEAFRSAYNKCLCDSEFEGFRWETPSLTQESASLPFEFVLVNSPGFCRRKTDTVTFRKKFDTAADQAVITFANLRGDATMIVPTPECDIDCYGHLASFVRNAPSSQVDQLWKVVGETMKRHISATPVWLSTAGGGVAWLHVRLDSTPKYYNYVPYRKLR